MIERQDILTECASRMMSEMYKWAQPSLDLDAFLEKAKERGWKDNPKDPIYRHHYLSQKNFLFIRQHYLDAYGLFDWWKESIETLEDNLKNGGLKDIWVPPVGEIGDDNFRPGYRDSVKVDSLDTYIGRDNADKVMQIISDYKDFYRFGSRDVNSVSITVTLGASPTSNKKEVEEYWAKRGEPIKIEDFDLENKIYGDECD